ncbi:hypothetical protein AVEN_163405-1, partial [Araneus ventricosus]
MKENSLFTSLVDENVDKSPYLGPSTNGKFIVYTVDENVDKPPY